ncbi:LITAF-like zinc ribbon domain-domain-containing protein [Clohesyomyces aquaticus]|uniref:LITAF-like zinc ribbon domain-domain-containing protein n=1 Tax=Clohesyomyces aquaticus TaxID=1231657 RepID=A0A1Y1YNE8_9PLEO|nr:LITAF-like zinc ribbon domain-domain-containing protein [Clohesyomyces aquaticus]
MEKQGVPMNQYPVSPDVTGAQPGAQPPMYQDPNQPQPQMHQNQAYAQPQQMQYAQSPPPAIQQQGSYGMQGQQQPGVQQHQAPQNPGMPPQQQSGTVYQSATPIASLNRSPAPADCPACGQRAMTNVSYEIGNTTHAWALGLCCFACLGCIPYLMNSLKDVQHKCGRCGVLLATWHRSGTTEVHIHS